MLALPGHVGDVTLGLGSFSPACFWRLFLAWKCLKVPGLCPKIARAHVTAFWKKRLRLAWVSGL